MVPKSMKTYILSLLYCIALTFHAFAAVKSQPLVQLQPLTHHWSPKAQMVAKIAGGYIALIALVYLCERIQYNYSEKRLVSSQEKVRTQGDADVAKLVAAADVKLRNPLSEKPNNQQSTGIT